jgi:hypothetical protein
VISAMEDMATHLILGQMGFLAGEFAAGLVPPPPEIVERARTAANAVLALGRTTATEALEQIRALAEEEADQYDSGRARQIAEIASRCLPDKRCSNV